MLRTRTALARETVAYDSRYAGKGRVGNARRCPRSSSIRACRVALRAWMQVSKNPSYASRDANARDPRSRNR